MERFAGSAGFQPAREKKPAGMPALPVTACAALLVLSLAAPAQEKPVPRDLPVAPGAVVDPGDFRCSRALGALPAGWTVLPLDAHVLSCAADDLGDLRLVDAGKRQIPYLLESEEKPLEIELPAPEPLPAAGGRSRFRLALPYRSLPGGKLVLSTDARIFERPVRLLRPASSARGEAVLASAVWRHDEPRTAAPTLELDLPRRAGGEIELAIDNADNPPLPLTSARLELPAHRLRFHAPDSAAESGLTLLYGRPKLPAPRYDLALLAGRAREISAQNAYLPTAPREEAESRSWLSSRKGIWAVLAGTILALLGLLARLLKTAPEARLEE